MAADSACVDALALRQALAHRVVDAHQALDSDGLTALLIGSTAEGQVDELSDIDMSLVFDTLPEEAALASACQQAGGGAWRMREGDLVDQGLVVAFDVQGIEVQIAYTNPRILHADLDRVLIAHEADSPYHKVCEGLTKAHALCGAERLPAWRERVDAFPPALGDAMMRHWVGQPTPWRWFTLLLRRDAGLWCRELQVQAGYRLFGMLAGLNRRYFTTFQFKRMHRFAASLTLAPPRFADRVENLLAAPLAQAFSALHALEGEVLAMLATHAPQIDLTAAHERRTRFTPRG